VSRKDRPFSSLKKCKFVVTDKSALREILQAVNQAYKNSNLRDFTDDEYSKLVTIYQDKATNFWDWLALKMELLANDESARLLFNGYYLGVCSAEDSKKLLDGQPEGTVVLRFGIRLPNACFVMDYNSKQEFKREPVMLTDVEKHGSLCNYIVNSKIKQLVPLSGNSQPLLREKCDLRSVPSNLDVLAPKRHKPNPSSDNTKPVKEWTAEEVKDWIQTREDWKKLGLENVPEKFLDQDVNGDALLCLTQDDLEKRLGIIKMGPLKRITELINVLRKVN